MAFVEGLICPACTTPVEEDILHKALICPHCKTNLKQKKFLAFIEYLIMHGLVDVDFFDEVLYGEGVKKSVEEKELEDETDPDEYEDKSERIKYVDAKHDLKEVTTDEEEFREWDGIEEDWQEFNRKHIHEENKPK
jgi:hypothetical protein